jgi:hypothetical protein
MTPASSDVDTRQATPDAAVPAPESTRLTGDLLICLTPLPPEDLEATLKNLAGAFPAEHQTAGNGNGNSNILVAIPDSAPASSPDSVLSTAAPDSGRLRLLHYSSSSTALFLTAADYLNAFKMAQEHNARACILLGPESQTLNPGVVRELAAALLGSSAADLVLPHYRLGPNNGLVNSAILYPVTRALYRLCPRFPQAIDVGLSLRMAERLAIAAQPFTAAGQNDAILWPVAEAAAANWPVAEIDAGPRGLPQPASTDLNALLSETAGSFFADIEARASVWQRVRFYQPGCPTTETPVSAGTLPDVTPMLEAFRVAYSNLQEIWSLVLPPQTLLGLKHLSLMPPAGFRMNDELWTRIVYDFILAYRLRTINRGHLLGALTPLYLAWVASHILLTGAGAAPEQHIEDLAATFERDKAYLVSRWRWPDRFNP